MPGTCRVLFRFLPALLLGLAGCERLLPGSGPPPQLYQLSPKSTFDDRLPIVQWQLTVEAPFASSALNTTRIAVMPAPVQIDYYARAAWTDRVPVMVQGLIVESFENSRRIVGIGRDTIGLRSDFVLKTELREFQAESFNPGGGLVRVALDAKLVKMPERVIVAANEFKETAQAAVDDMPSVIGGFDQALGRLMKQLVAWTLLSGDAAVAQARAAASVEAAPAAQPAPAFRPVLPGRAVPTRSPPVQGEAPRR